MSAVTFVPIAEVKAVVDLLAELGLTPLHLQVDASHAGEARPSIRVWTRFRAEFEQVAKALGAEVREPRPAGSEGLTREYLAHVDTDRARIQVACTSRAHHHDWIPRGGGS